MAMMRTLLLLAIFFGMLLACGDSPIEADPKEGAPSKGQLMFNAQCALCHGRKGDLCLSGAKNLALSVLERDQMIAVVTNGKGAMMAYKTVFGKKEIEAVVDHVITLRKPS